MAKDRKKGDKIVSESQEKAYWRVYRPPPGFTTVVENSPVPSREQRVKARNRTYEHLAEEVLNPSLFPQNTTIYHTSACINSKIVTKQSILIS